MRAVRPTRCTNTFGSCGGSYCNLTQKKQRISLLSQHQFPISDHLHEIYHVTKRQSNRFIPAQSSLLLECQALVLQHQCKSACLLPLLQMLQVLFLELTAGWMLVHQKNLMYTFSVHKMHTTWQFSLLIYSHWLGTATFYQLYYSLNKAIHSSTCKRKILLKPLANLTVIHQGCYQSN